MMASFSGVAEIRQSLSELMAPVSEESVCTWVENNVELPTGAITGKVQLNYIPYAREILERYGDKTTRHLILAFATQLAKTTILSCGMLYKIARDPESAMWVMANADQARDFNKERFMPFVRLCKPVMDMVPRTSKGVVDKHLWGFQNQHYASMVLNFVGAGSPANLASRPRGLIQCDEVDKFYDSLSFDAGTIQLVEERQKTFHFPLCVKASSPTLADRMIWVEYLKSDMRQYWVPCPRCGDHILLKFRAQSEKHGDCGLRWWHENEEEAKTDGAWDLKKVRANAFYKCQECGGMIHSFERQDMLQEGVWKPQNSNAETGRHGYNLSSLYSILGQETSFASIASKWIISKGLRSEMQNFFNGWLAEPWDESRQYDLKEVQLRAFSPQQIPEEAVPLMAVDVQQRGFWCLVRKFAAPTKDKPTGESWLLFADFVETEDELVEIQNEYGVLSSNVTADMAHRPSHVAKMILRNGWTGIMGSDTRKFQHPGPGGTKVHRHYSVVQFRDPHLGTAWESRTFQRVPYVLFSKHDIMDLVSALRYSEPAIWHATVNVTPRYARQINGRVKRQQKNKRTGRIQWEWCELHQELHLLDCEGHVTVKALAQGFIMPPDETEALNVN
jgi:DNA-directed RNA polymerase subunit RPC12/RpoP